MLPTDKLKDLLADRSFSVTDKLLLCLAVDPVEAREVKDIKRIGRGAGWRTAEKKNVSQLLKNTRGLAVRTDAGWELTAKGIQQVSTLAGPVLGAPAPTTASGLRAHLAAIMNADTRRFVEEAIACMEQRSFRASVVLSWVGAVALLKDHVIANDLIAFNAEATKRNAKWKKAKTSDDVGQMKEYDFLQILVAISVIGKNVKAELEACLKLRNGCGHPNSLRLADHRVASHVEILTLNVFSKF